MDNGRARRNPSENYQTSVAWGKIPIVVKSKYCITNHIQCDECKFDPDDM